MAAVSCCVKVIDMVREFFPSSTDSPVPPPQSVARDWLVESRAIVEDVPLGLVVRVNPDRRHLVALAEHHHALLHDLTDLVRELRAENAALRAGVVGVVSVPVKRKRG